MRLSVYIPLFLIFGATLIFFTLGGRIGIVSGSSMEPSFKDGDMVLINNFSSLSTGDIVAIQIDGEILIKRIVAAPGDIVYYDKYEYSVNEDTLSTISNKETLHKDQYFVIGDNINISVDSRSFGPINRHQIIGRITTKF